MADNKNQHFVPKAHLKPFSVDGEGKAIHLFNLDADRAIPNGAVRKQCSHDYFYGQDKQLERAIQTIEGAYGSAIQRLITHAANPTALDRLVLRRFVLLQHLRTEAASVSASQIAAALAQLPGVLPDGEAFNPKAAMLEAVQAAMLFYARSMKIVDDLQMTLVRNRTATPFVTSDDPAVLTNRWHLQNPRGRGLAFGVRSGGWRDRVATRRGSLGPQRAPDPQLRGEPVFPDMGRSGRNRGRGQGSSCAAPEPATSHDLCRPRRGRWRARPLRSAALGRHRSPR